MTKDESPAIISTPAPISQEINAGTTTTPAPFTNEIKDKIQTSRFRNNVIHDYELNYLPTTAYLCFIDNDEYKLLQQDDYRTEDYRLELAIHEEEEKSWLIMVYSDGRVVKASVEKLLHRDSDRTFKRYSGKELIYASIASDDDEIILGFVMVKATNDCASTTSLRSRKTACRTMARRSATSLSVIFTTSKSSTATKFPSGYNSIHQEKNSASC